MTRRNFKVAAQQTPGTVKLAVNLPVPLRWRSLDHVELLLCLQGRMHGSFMAATSSSTITTIITTCHIMSTSQVTTCHLCQAILLQAWGWWASVLQLRGEVNPRGICCSSMQRQQRQRQRQALQGSRKG
jgi:hypothetical protein